MKVLATNRELNFKYEVLETYTCGIELKGTEVKSVRQGSVNLKDSWVNIKDGEAFIMGMHISPYEKGNIFNKDPLRVRKLLLHRREIDKLFGLVKQDGYSLIPTSLYLKGSYVKLEVALAKGKKLYDKRETEAKKSAKRDIERAVRQKF